MALPLASAGMGLLGAGIGIAGALIGSGKKPKIPQYVPVNVGRVQQQAIEENLAAAPGAEALASRTNIFNQQQLMAMLEKAVPGYKGMNQQISKNIQAALRGELAPDVQQSIARMAASRAAGAGVSGSQYGRNIELRDLGLTSYQSSQTSLQQAMQYLQLQRVTTVPDLMSSASMFLTPSQRVEWAMQENDRLYQNALLQAQVAAQPSPRSAAIGGVLTSIGGAMAGAGMQGVLESMQPNIPQQFMTPRYITPGQTAALPSLATQGAIRGW